MVSKKLSEEPFIHPNCQLVNAKLGEYTEVGMFNFFENVVLDDYSYTGQFCYLQNVVVGKFSNIAAMVRIGPTNHPLDRPTLHHFTYRRVMYGLDQRDDQEFFKERTAQTAWIGHDTWLGHGVIIMPGIKLGNGVVVGSGAVVTRDVAPYQIVVGVPASSIRKRFSDDIIIKLELIKWWDWSYQTIKSRLKDFTLSAAEFVGKYYTDR